MAFFGGEMQPAEKVLLERLTPHVTRGDEQPDLYFFSLADFSDELTGAAEADSRCHLVTVADLFR